MKIFITAVMALIFPAILATAALAEPEVGDLQVRSVEYSAASNRLVASIFNQAPVAVPGPILVYFYDGDTKLGEVTYSEAVPRYSIVSVYITYTITEGTHNFRAVVDPLNTAAETLENNNERGVTLIYSDNESVTSIAPSVRQQAAQAAQTQTGSGPWAAAGAAIIGIALAAYIALKILGGGKHGGRELFAADRAGKKRTWPKIRIGMPKKTEGEEERRGWHREEHRSREPRHEVRHEAKTRAAAQPQESGHWKFWHRAKPGAGGETARVKELKAEHEARTGALTEAQRPAAAPPAQPAVQTAAGMKIRQVIGLAKGTQVRFRAQMQYHDQIGKDHAYFLRDGTDEIVGFSREKIAAQEAVITGVVDRFLGDNTCVMIEKAE